MLSGSLMLLVVSSFLTSGDAINYFLTGLFQVFQGAISPRTQAQVLFSSYSSFVATNSAVSVFALLSAKIAAVNMLPLFSLSGGQALVVFAESISKWRYEDHSIFILLEITVIFVVLVSWAVALFFFLFLPALNDFRSVLTISAVFAS